MKARVNIINYNNFQGSLKLYLGTDVKVKEYESMIKSLIGLTAHHRLFDTCALLDGYTKIAITDGESLVADNWYESLHFYLHVTRAFFLIVI